MLDRPDQPYSIFSKDGTSKLWVRFSIKGEGQVRKSLGISDPEIARQKAHEVWFEANYRSRNGLKARTTSFAKAAEDFIAMVEREVERGDRPAYHSRDIPPVIRRYFIEFFGKKDIDAIAERTSPAISNGARIIGSPAPARTLRKSAISVLDVRSGDRLARNGFPRSAASGVNW